MIIFSRSFFVFLIISLNQPAQAQLFPEKSVMPRLAEKYVLSIPHKEWGAYIEKHGAVIRNEETKKIDKPESYYPFSRSLFAWNFRGHDTFYTSIHPLRTDSTPPKRCKVDPSDENFLGYDQCDRAIDHFVQCHLLIYGVERQLLGVLPLNIPQADFIPGKTGCFEVHAMASAKIVKDGMLIVLGYYDSRWTCTSAGPICVSESPAAYPNPYYKTTLLVRFDKDDQGKLVMQQDDNCLGSLNNYATINAAMAALKKSGCT